MADTKVRLDAACDSDLHGEHLCYIISQGLHLTDASKYRAMVTDPRFRCGHCGRAAASRDNLCVPMGL
jgi:hypothetical protein